MAPRPFTGRVSHADLRVDPINFERLVGVPLKPVVLVDVFAATHDWAAGYYLFKSLVCRRVRKPRNAPVLRHGLSAAKRVIQSRKAARLLGAALFFYFQCVGAPQALLFYDETSTASGGQISVTDDRQSSGRDKGAKVATDPQAGQIRAHVRALLIRLNGHLAKSKITEGLRRPRSEA